MNKGILLGGLTAVALGGYFVLFPKPEPVAPAPDIVHPLLTRLAAAGEVAYQGTCAACHGPNLTGTENGPPLLHPYYKPDHHGDFAFVRAVQNGVQPHHWRFGPMPAQPHIGEEALVQIITYIREMQRANGII